MWLFFKQIQGLFTPPCLLCGSLQGNYDNYCSACYADLPHRHQDQQTSCQICAVQLAPETTTDILCPDCLQQPPAYDKVHSALHYLPPITSLMHAFKDQGQQACGRLLSACLLRHLREHVNDPLPQGLLPVPLHPLRQRQRGFNQAQIIATHVGHGLGIPVLTRHCSRQAHTASQQGQNKAQRRRNLRRVFRVDRPLAAIHHLAIIDDVITTGSTTHALASAIRQSAQQDIRISVWSLARALPPQHKLHLR